MANAKLLLTLLVSFFVSQSICLTTGGRPGWLTQPYKRAPLQNIVTWDKHSIFVRGERVLFYSGEYHPFRLPVPSLWLDVFQKIKALGYSGVSFYVDWALLEGKQGNFTAEGVFALEPFFQAASDAGIYLLARPGPYINAEVSGGGYPGWLQRTKAVLRTPDYIKYTENYVKNVGVIIAKAQITNGGPVILVQPENEYTYATSSINPFPNREYFQVVENQLRAAGIVVPFISNDASPNGNLVPGSGVGAVDIYGHDGYPLGFDCANPTTWPNGRLPTNYRTLHLRQSPSTPYSIVEFQGGSFDPWGGPGFGKCEILLNSEFERVFYKNDFSFGVTVFNIYMTYGGTNWGNLGHPGGYTSYDYAAVIAEDRTVAREKYSEAKLEATFLRSSPAYLTAVPGNFTTTMFTNNPAITVTPVVGNETTFYVIRHTAYNTFDSTSYTLTVPSSQGIVRIPQLSSTLTLNGRDSKIHVTDYDIGLKNSRLLYSSAEIFTWKNYGGMTILILYGGPGESHEAAFTNSKKSVITEGSGVQIEEKNGALVLNWATTPSRKVVDIDENLTVYLLNRNDAYNYWVLDLPSKAPTDLFASLSATSAIVKAGYLMRTAVIHGDTLVLKGDLNATTTIEVVGNPDCSKLEFNGKQIASGTNEKKVLSGTMQYNAPKSNIPPLSDLQWKYVDSLPEIQLNYDDSAWPPANQKTTNNPRALTTPTSLYASDYGFNTGNLLFRGHFTATGTEKSFSLETQGGSAYGASVWLDSTFVGSWPGIDKNANYNSTFTLPNLKAGQNCVFTVLIDDMGNNEDFSIGTDDVKQPRGILKYNLDGHAQSDISWRLTGNLGGEDYRDHVRGPLNEGGLYAERQGYHLPRPPNRDWKSSKPTDGITKAGVFFYTAEFKLDMPDGYDIPLAFNFANTTVPVPDYRVQLYVNGYQFGKYVNNIGPQKSFPVPEGILNYQGSNFIALSLWALDAKGAKVEDVQLVATAEILTGYGRVANSPMPSYEKRAGAY